MHQMVRERLPLPTACALSPMAEEVYQQQLVLMKPLLTQLQRLDRLFT